MTHLTQDQQFKAQIDQSKLLITTALYIANSPDFILSKNSNLLHKSNVVFIFNLSIIKMNFNQLYLNNRTIYIK